MGTQGGDTVHVARESGFGGNRPAHTWLTKDRMPTPASRTGNSKCLRFTPPGCGPLLCLLGLTRTVRDMLALLPDLSEEVLSATAMHELSRQRTPLVRRSRDVLTTRSPH